MMVWLVAAFIFFFILSTPIAAAIGLSALPVVFGNGYPINVVAQRLFASLDSFTLLAIPFFILAGTLMEGGGISRRLIHFANTCVGDRPGGLATVTIVASMFFAAVSGSGSATAAAIGSIMIPAMVDKRYEKRFACATTATSAQIGVIIPPSIPMVLYCVGTSNSIGTIFIAGIVPGLLIGVSLILYSSWVSRRRGYVGEKRYSGVEKWNAFREAIFALIMPVIILGGIYSGVFTPTESAAIACAYALVIGIFVYREIKVRDLIQIFFRSSITVAVVMLILSTAGLFSYVLTINQVPQMVANFFLALSDNKYVFLIIVNVLLFFVGMFFDGGPAMIILAPILAPVAVALGIDPIHFGIIMVCNSALGQITPPFGVNLFVVSQVAEIKMESMVRELLPYIGIVILDIMLVTYLPAISTGLPKLLGVM